MAIPDFPDPESALGSVENYRFPENNLQLRSTQITFKIRAIGKVYCNYLSGLL
jgi:hypothetical protein